MFESKLNRGRANGYAPLAYDAIGNWTNEQVESRVKELVLAGQMGE